MVSYFCGTGNGLLYLKKKNLVRIRSVKQSERQTTELKPYNFIVKKRKIVNAFLIGFLIKSRIDIERDWISYNWFL